MEISFEKLIKLIKENLLGLMAAGLVCFGVMFAYMTFAVKPQYYSSIKFNIVEADSAPSASSTQLTYERSKVDTYIAVLDTNDFYKQVRQSLPAEIKGKYSARALKSGTRLASVNATEIMSVTFVCGDTDDAVAIVSAIYDCIQPRIVGTLGECSVYLVDSATPATASASRKVAYSVVAFILGAIFVFVLIFIKDVMDLRVKGTADLTEKYGLPVLGTVPSFKNGGKDRRNDNG